MLAGELPFDETTMIDEDHAPAAGAEDETPAAAPAPRAPEAAVR